MSLIKVGTGLMKACANKMLRGVTREPNTPSLDYLYMCDPEEVFKNDGKTAVLAPYPHPYPPDVPLVLTNSLSWPHLHPHPHPHPHFPVARPV